MSYVFVVVCYMCYILHINLSDKYNMFKFFWSPCIVINVSVQHNGGLLSDFILLTQSYCHWGTRLNVIK